MTNHQAERLGELAAMSVSDFTLGELFRALKEYESASLAVRAMPVDAGGNAEPSQALTDAMATQEAINAKREAALLAEEARASAPRDQALEQPVLPQLMRLRVKPGEGYEITPVGEDEPRRTHEKAGYN